MIVTVSEYTSLYRDANSNIVPATGSADLTTKLTAAGDVTTLPASEFVRLATDTAIHVSIGSAASTNSAWMPANAVEVFSVIGGQVVSVVVAA